MNHHQCYFHPNHKIIKFCSLKQCTLPLCQLCEPIHIQEHQNNHTNPQIVSFIEAHSKAVSQLQTLINDYRDQKQSATSSLIKEKQNIIKLIQKHYEQKLSHFNSSIALFQQVENKFNKIKKGSLKSMIMFYTEDHLVLRSKLNINQKNNTKSQSNIKKIELCLFNFDKQQQIKQQIKQTKKQVKKSKEIDEIIFASNSQNKSQNYNRVNNCDKKELKTVNQKIQQQKDRQYQQRVYKQIKQQVLKQRQKSNSGYNQDSIYRPKTQSEYLQFDSKHKNYDLNKQKKQKFQDTKSQLSKIKQRYGNSIKKEQIKTGYRNQNHDLSDLSPIGKQSAQKVKRVDFQQKYSQNNYINLQGKQINFENQYQNSSKWNQKINQQNYPPHYNSSINNSHSKKNDLNLQRQTKSPIFNITIQKKQNNPPFTFQGRSQKKSQKYQLYLPQYSQQMINKRQQIDKNHFFKHSNTQIFQQYKSSNKGQLQNNDQMRNPLEPKQINLNIYKNASSSKFDYEKLSKEVLSPQQIRKMLQKRMEDKNKPSDGKMTRFQNLQKVKSKQITKYENYGNYKDNERTDQYYQRRDLQSKDSIINQIFSDSHY